MTAVRLALRTLGRHRGFTVVAVLSLAVAIALNTTMYSVMATLLDAGINARKPENVYGIQYFGDRAKVLAPEVFESALRTGLGSYEATSGALPSRDALVESGARHRRVKVRTVRSNYFEFLGAMPAAGRIFAARDEGDPVVVISDRLARQLFDDGAAIGRSLLLNGDGVTVVGVVRRSPSFAPIADDLWIPRLPTTPPVPMTLIRMRERVDTTRARVELAVISARLALAAGEPPAQNRFHFKPIGRQMQLGPFHKALFGAVLAVLLVACANLANLQLARGLARSRELAVRSAVGASRAQIVNHLLTETGVIAAAGLLLGIALTLWGIWVIRATVPPEIESHVVAPAISWGMFGFAAGAAVLCLFLVGLLPALRVSRVDPNSLLKAGSGTGANRAHRRRYGVMVVAQIGFALPVLVGAVVSLKGAWRYHDRDFFARDWFGYDPLPVTSGGLSIDGGPTARTHRFLHINNEVVPRLEKLPSVAGAAVEFWKTPLKNMVTVDDPGGSPRELMAHGWSYRVVSPSFQRVFGRHMEQGRDFDERDVGTGSIIMDAPTARFLWKNENPIGRSIKFANADSDAPWHRVIGVVGDMRDTFAIRRSMRDANYRLYSVYQVIGPDDSMVVGAGRSLFVSVHARGTGNMDLASMRIQQELRSLRWGERVMSEPFATWLSANRVRTDWVAGLFTTFALIGMALVIVGVYGIVAHSVAERRRELAVRISLGATARNIMHAVLREGNVLILAGTAIGLYLTRGTVWWLGAFMFEEDGYDAPLFALIAAALFTIALVSALAPALRATRIDPVEALRHE